MIVLLHVTVALLSVAFATVVYIKPSKNKFYFSYVLVALTIISGTFLIIKSPSHMVQSCIMGIAYVGVVLATLVLAKKKLARQTEA
jgi:hypothetical protein